MPVLRAKGIEKPFTFLRKNGFTHQVAKNLISTNRVEINLKQLEHLCEILWCEPTDFLEWHASPNKIVPEGHPLLKLTPKEQPMVNLKKLIEKVPYEKLNKISTVLAKEIEDAKKGGS